jgi:hypothetical protein
MKRDYKDGVSDNMNFFIGNEVEHNPALGVRTLFVVGIQNEQVIEHLLADENSHEDKSKRIGQIFFGANHSFNPQSYDEWKAWEEMISYFLDQGYWCSVDIPITLAEEFLENGLNEYNNFIPQLRVPIPYINQYNYNTVIKLDDKGFNATNPGVWCHSLHTLKDRSKFTDWTQYKNDKGIK